VVPCFLYSTATVQFALSSPVMRHSTPAHSMVA
jgi:hypothetical protein